MQTEDVPGDVTHGGEDNLPSHPGHLALLFLFFYHFKLYNADVLLCQIKFVMLYTITSQ